MKQTKNHSADIFTIPNILSFIRICMIPFIAWLYCGKQDYLLAGLLLIVSGVTDLVDGYLARRFGWISDLGKVLDPFADKLTQATMLVCLALRYPLMLCPFLLMVAKELFMTIVGLTVIKKTGVVGGARWHGKLATCLLYANMILHIFWFNIPATVSLLCIVACTVMIGVSFVFYGMDNIRALRQYKVQTKQ